MNIKKLYDELSKLKQEEVNYLIEKLMIDGKISYETISLVYVTYLEHIRNKNNRKESMFANCLANAIRPCTEEEWLHSQAYVLINKHIPDEWINEYLNKRNDEMIEKNRKLLNE